ncbi:hypothetical protein [Thioalkalivibrio sp. ALE19]|uniref:hypothetical protein n=1 Tax=Thioalkalivibrio sp. ALE19 TaxID=1266909 RepID=UPI0012DE58A8|nr:hypothetical protein [Thioalkalivibrio sp. ALE19]
MTQVNARKTKVALAVAMVTMTGMSVSAMENGEDSEKFDLDATLEERGFTEEVIRGEPRDSSERESPDVDFAEFGEDSFGSWKGGESPGLACEAMGLEEVNGSCGMTDEQACNEAGLNWDGSSCTMTEQAMCTELGLSWDDGSGTCYDPDNVIASEPVASTQCTPGQVYVTNKKSGGYGNRGQIRCASDGETLEGVFGGEVKGTIPMGEEGDIYYGGAGRFVQHNRMLVRNCSDTQCQARIVISGWRPVSGSFYNSENGWVSLGN